MSMAKKIRILLIERDMTMTDLAKKLETSKSNLSDKMKRDNFSEKELIEIADVLNSDFKDEMFVVRKDSPMVIGKGERRKKYKFRYSCNSFIYKRFLSFKW